MKLVIGRAHHPHWRIADLGIFGDIDQVTGGRQFRASGQAPTMHLGNDRLGQVPDAKTALDHMPSPLAGPARRGIG